MNFCQGLKKFYQIFRANFSVQYESKKKPKITFKSTNAEDKPAEQTKTKNGPQIPSSYEHLSQKIRFLVVLPKKFWTSLFWNWQVRKTQFCGFYKFLDLTHWAAEMSLTNFFGVSKNIYMLANFRYILVKIAIFETFWEFLGTSWEFPWVSGNDPETHGNFYKKNSWFWSNSGNFMVNIFGNSSAEGSKFIRNF